LVLAVSVHSFPSDKCKYFAHYLITYFANKSPMVNASASPLIETFLSQLAHQPAVLVQVSSTQGSVPREAGTWMAVFSDRAIGTIGGGHLEYQAIAQARAQLAGVMAAVAADLRFALGPALGQCCGGVVYLSFQPVSASDIPALSEQLNAAALGALTPVALFGGGHVGQALVQALAPLPFRLSWIDSRDGVFPDSVPPRVVCEHSEPVQAAVVSVAPHSRVLIMSFSHAEDLAVLAACLKRHREQADLPYIGLIGSKTKWATFKRRLEARGFTPAELAHVTCPIGVPGITGKEPEVIAVAVAAQLLQTIAAQPGTAP
jgi:xanthine dehydrogenase accessory factor